MTALLDMPFTFIAKRTKICTAYIEDGYCHRDGQWGLIAGDIVLALRAPYHKRIIKLLFSDEPMVPFRLVAKNGHELRFKGFGKSLIPEDDHRTSRCLLGVNEITNTPRNHKRPAPNSPLR